MVARTTMRQRLRQRAAAVGAAKAPLLTPKPQVPRKHAVKWLKARVARPNATPLAAPAHDLPEDCH